MIAFVVSGIPATKGSARAVKSRSTGRPVLLASASGKNARAQKSWAHAVGWAARQAMAGRPPIAGPVEVRCVFWLPKAKTSKLETPRGDLDKLLRATWDAMTGIVFVDDVQVADAGKSCKWFASGKRGPGAMIEIKPLGMAAGMRQADDEQRSVEIETIGTMQAVRR